MGDGKYIIALISGGISPIKNMYSQYLQAKKLEEYLRDKQDIELSVYHGSGITPETPMDVTPDVQKEGKDGTEFIRGEIPNNHPATKASVMDYFFRLKGRDWDDDDRFILFVADHGGPNDDVTDVFIGLDNKVQYAYKNNCISLWDVDSLLYPEKGCLSVSDIKKAISDNVPEDVPVNYVMSQCYSGGFHYLAFSEDENGLPHKSGNTCGFTAATKDTVAAGCTAFVDGDLWDGYEKRIAEALMGRILTDKDNELPVFKPLNNLSEAHDWAVVNDGTADVPLRSSEAYVLEYYEAIVAQQKIDETPIDVQLDGIWVRYNSEKHVKESLGNILESDRERRLALIGRLTALFNKNYPIYSSVLGSGDVISRLKWQIRGIDEIIGDINARKEKIDNAFKEKYQPICRRYDLFIKNSPSYEDKVWLEYENLNTSLDDEHLFLRLKGEDPTLGKYKKFLKFKDAYLNRVIDWAFEHPEYFSAAYIYETLELKQKQKMLENEIVALKVVKGQMQKIETQTRTLAMIEWLAKNKGSKVLQDVEGLVECETEAVFIR